MWPRNGARTMSRPPTSPFPGTPATTVFPSAIRTDEFFRSRPRSQITEQMIKRPVRLHLKFGRLQFGEREGKSPIAGLHEMPLRIPIWPDGLAIEPCHQGIDRRRNFE